MPARGFDLTRFYAHLMFLRYGWEVNRDPRDELDPADRWRTLYRRLPRPPMGQCQRCPGLGPHPRHRGR